MGRVISETENRTVTDLSKTDYQGLEMEHLLVAIKTRLSWPSKSLYDDLDTWLIYARDVVNSGAWRRLAPTWREFIDNHVRPPAELLDMLQKAEGVLTLDAKEIIDRLARNKDVAQEYAEGMSQAAIAEKYGIAQQTVSDIVTGKQVMTGKPKRERKVLQLSSGTKPETAAQKIRDTFGDEFADQLKALL